MSFAIDNPKLTIDVRSSPTIFFSEESQREINDLIKSEFRSEGKLTQIYSEVVYKLTSLMKSIYTIFEAMSASGQMKIESLLEVEKKVVRLNDKEISLVNILAKNIFQGNVTVIPKEDKDYYKEVRPFELCPSFLHPRVFCQDLRWECLLTCSLNDLQGPILRPQVVHLENYPKNSRERIIGMLNNLYPHYSAINSKL